MLALLEPVAKINYELKVNPLQVVSGVTPATLYPILLFVGGNKGMTNSNRRKKVSWGRKLLFHIRHITLLK